MSAAAAPWSVKGIDPKAREIAKDLARRSGMTLGEWLNSMIMDEPEDDDQVATLPRRSPIPDPYDRRSRSRRLDDAYDGPSIGVIADRLEASERRSTEAVRSIEEAVANLVRRIDRQEVEQSNIGRRVEAVSEELREGHLRLKRVEQRDTDPASEERLLHVSQRLDEAQIQTQAALRALERSFATLDDRLRATEGRVEPETAREASRFERLAETLSRQVEGNRVEMMRRLDVVEIESRADRLERAFEAVAQSSREAEKKSAAAVEAMGHEVMRIARNLDGRLERVEGEDQIQKLGHTLSDKLERDLERHVQSVDHRLSRHEDHHARAIERLGDEITRISDRLSDRIASSERRSAEALDDIGRRLAEHSDRIEQRHHVSGELADRMRQSEERTAQLLAEARENMSQRAQRASEAPAPIVPLAQPSTHAAAAASPSTWPAAETEAKDWRAVAFGDVGDDWSDDDLDGLLAAAPFPTPAGDPLTQAADRAAGASVFVDPLEAELAAWVDEKSAENTSSGLFGSSPEVASFGILSASADALDEAPAELEDSASETALGYEPLALEDTETKAHEPGFEDEGLVPQSDLLPPILEDDASADPSAFDDFLNRPLNEPLDEPASVQVDAQADDVYPIADSFDALNQASAQGETEDPLFIDPNALKAGAEAGRLSTREALDAARAAMTEGEEPARKGFLLKRRGGKSKLQERLDDQAQGKGSGIRKMFGASVLAALVVGGGYGFLELSETDQGQVTGKTRGQTPSGNTKNEAQAQPLAAMALSMTPTEATPSTDVAASEGAALFERAVELLDRGDDRGLEALTRAAELGHAGAQLRLAGLYQDGEAGLDANPVEARSWARRAAEGGDPRAMHYYAMQLYDGVGGAQNRAGALGWLKRAAEAGRVDSQYNVARLYEVGDTGVAQNPLEAYKWYMIAARRGDQQALASVQRLTPTLDVDTRRKAREGADAFNVDPIG